VVGVPAHAEEERALLQLSGVGGQSTTLDIGARALTLAAPIFRHPRLPGGDGAVGGLIVQRGSQLVGGMVLINAPGFPYALTWELTGPEDLRLSKGRYRVTLLGAGRQTVQMIITSGQPSQQLRAAGMARPVTRTFSGNGTTMHEWSHRLGDLKAGDTLILGSGSTGTPDAHAAQTCLRRGSTASASPCLEVDDVGFHAPGGASYGGSSQTVREDEGPFTYSGQIQTVGMGTRSGHVAVVISPRP
jgi:hypothetical protein